MSIRNHSRKPRYDISIEELRGHVVYNPHTGHLCWAKQTSGRTLGKPFGRSSKTPYIQFGFSCRVLLAHRAAFALTYGYWPDEVDHINGNKRDNRISNLREVTRSINILNRKKPHSGNTSGYTGVCLHSATGKWRAYVKVNGKQVAKYCTSKKEAVQARRELLNKYYPEIR